MKIGEYFIEKEYITQEDLDKALALQKQNRDMRLGDLLVKSGALQKDELEKYVVEFMNIDSGEANLDEWLTQDQVDALVAQFINDQAK